MNRYFVFLCGLLLLALGLSACGGDSLAPLPPSELPKVEEVKPVALVPPPAPEPPPSPLPPLTLPGEMGSMVGMTVEGKPQAKSTEAICEAALAGKNVLYQQGLREMGVDAAQFPAHWDAWKKQAMTACMESQCDPQCFREAMDKSALEACLPLQAY